MISLNPVQFSRLWMIQSIATVGDHEPLQVDLNQLLQWCAKWQLNFNISKCTINISYGKKHQCFGGIATV